MNTVEKEQVEIELEYPVEVAENMSTESVGFRKWRHMKELDEPKVETTRDLSET